MGHLSQNRPAKKQSMITDTWDLNPMPPHSSPRIVTLTTDFGFSDPWVAELKASILSVAADVTLVDVSHAIAAFAIRQAAYVVQTASRQFPPGTIHVVGVDPHPSTRGLLVASQGQLYIGPDNGVLTPFLTPNSQEPSPVQAFELNKSQYWGHPQPTTFRARDVFGPVAAHLTRGISPDQAGTPIALESLATQAAGCPTGDEHLQSGEVVHVDRFGNLITSIPTSNLTTDCSVRISDYCIQGLSRSYDDPVGDQPLLAVVGSGGFLEICRPQGNASEFIGQGQGTPVSVDVGDTP